MLLHVFWGLFWNILFETHPNEAAIATAAFCVACTFGSARMLVLDMLQKMFLVQQTQNSKMDRLSSKRSAQLCLQANEFGKFEDTRAAVLERGVCGLALRRGGTCTYANGRCPNHIHDDVRCQSTLDRDPRERCIGLSNRRVRHHRPAASLGHSIPSKL